jgi:formylglycine-generating enzyme required for sulfatase activity
MQARYSPKITVAVLCVATALVVTAAWNDIRFYIRFQPLGRNDQGYYEYKHRRTGIVMVMLPGGIFDMGCAESTTTDFLGLPPVREVELSPFLIAKYETTQREWSTVMDRDPSYLKGPDLPVNSVIWNECKEFCDRAGLALPSEAQWEFACRGMTATRFWSGDGEEDLATAGWYEENSQEELHQGGLKCANPLGLYDVHGNVWEWCQDGSDDQWLLERHGRDLDPVCPIGKWKVLRGGHFGFGEIFARSAYRGAQPATFSAAFIGFRASYRP